MRSATKNIHLGMETADPVYGSVSPPIFTTSTYIFPNAATGADYFAGRKKGLIYSRFTNPTLANKKAIKKLPSKLSKK